MEPLESALARHAPEMRTHRPGNLLCACGKLEPLDGKSVYIEFTAEHIAAVVAPYAARYARCPEECGCVLDGEDADRNDCGCNGPCCDGEVAFVREGKIIAVRKTVEINWAGPEQSPPKEAAPATRGCIGCLVDSAPHTCGYEVRTVPRWRNRV